MNEIIKPVLLAVAPTPLESFFDSTFFQNLLFIIILIVIVVAVIYGIKRSIDTQKEKKYKESIARSEISIPTNGKGTVCKNCGAAYVPGRDAFCISCGQKIE